MNNFSPLSCLLDSGRKNALIVLNQPPNIATLSTLWGSSIFKAVTDGAANHLHKLALDCHTAFIPDLISGDFDSAKVVALDYFKEKEGVEIVPTPDQDETDFTKCLRLVAQHPKVIKEAEQIVAVGAFGGRFDHCLANINTLFTARSFTTKPVVLVGENNVALLLDKGDHTLYMDTGLEGEWCGLVPVGTPAKCVTTTGLKYNLKEQGMAFGDLISTSNSLAGLEVTVSTDQPLLWMQGHKDNKC